MSENIKTLVVKVSDTLPVRLIFITKCESVLDKWHNMEQYALILEIIITRVPVIFFIKESEQ